MNRGDAVACSVRGRLVRRLLAGLFVISALCGVGLGRAQEQRAHADSFARAQRRLVANNPPGATLVLRLTEGKTRWRPGEILPLQLAFSSDRLGAYVVQDHLYDRSGRVGTEAFHLDRADSAVDPLGAYFHGERSGGGGSVSSSSPLGRQEQVVSCDLNEWFRFERPGRYRLYVTSDRVSSNAERTARGAEPLPVTSNVIEFEVLPRDDAWERATLKRTLADLDAASGDPANGVDAEQERRSPCRTLRFLDTEDAAREMVRRFARSDRVCDFEYFFGLVGSPHQELVAKEMEKGLVDPSTPVSLFYLDTLARIAAGIRLPAESRAPYPPGGDDAVEAWRKGFGRVMDAQNDLLLTYARKLSLSLGTKRPEARALSIQTLLGVLERVPPDARTGDVASWAERLPAQVAHDFVDLPPDVQSRLLDLRWLRTTGTAMVPALRRLFEDPPRGSDPDFRDGVLRLVYALSPDEGRQMILDEVRRPCPRVGFDALSVLPDDRLPELDEILADTLERNVPYDEPDEDAEDEAKYRCVETASRLVERYATSAILPRVLEVYRRVPANAWGCFPQAALLAFVCRNDPATGARLVRESLAARDQEQSRCYASVLAEVGAYGMNAELEAVVVDALSDEDPEIVSSAATVLASNGSAAAEAALWRRLEAWHAKWQDQAAEMSDKIASLPEEGFDRLSVDALVESALVRALARGHAWLADNERLVRLKSLCLTRASASEVDALLDAGPPTISISFDEVANRPSYISVGPQYTYRSADAARQKLTQFPAGTTFTLKDDGGESREAQRFAADLKSFLEERGYQLRGR